MGDESVNSLVQQAQRGDAKSFETLLNLHYRLIFRTAYKWCGRREDAEDITQNVCIRLAESIRDYRGESQFTTWLYRVTLNAAKDYQKSRSRKAGREQGDIDLSLFRSEQPNAEESLIARHLYWCIAQLTEKLRMAILLVCAEGMSHAEAGRVLECKEGTISWRISEAKKHLSTCLYEKEAV